VIPGYRGWRMSSWISEIPLVAADSPGPRGDNPETLGGILIVVGIVLAVLVMGFVGYLVMQRLGRSRHDAARRPHRPGRVGRVWEFRGRR
jgi:hypothetical protein